MKTLSEVIIEFSLPLIKPFKKTEKDELFNELISSVSNVGGNEVKIHDSYYMNHRAAAEPPIIFFIVLGAIADIVTIILGFRDFLRKKPQYKEFNLKTDALEITIKGNMSDKEIVKIVREGRKIVEPK